ncbi:MAG TPA: hypothetical protein V6C88_21285 [Chroococcidiopsis sp.]
MNPDIILQSVQKSFRTTLGAAAFVVDLVQQQPEQRDENLNRLKTDFNQVIEEWAVRGETTEQEARTFVENIVQQATAGGQTSGGAGSPPESAPPSAIQTDLKDLTEQITAMRLELEKLRQQDS